MSQPVDDFSKASFVRHVVMPALWVFLLPVIGLLFFNYATDRLDREIGDALAQQIQADQTLPEAERAEWLRYVREVPVSEMVRDPQMSGLFESDLLFDFATFRWMIRAAVICIASGLFSFVFVGISVLFSRRSQSLQALTLRASWQLLRVVSALQAIGQGALIVGLSYWATALLTNSYYPQFIFICGILVVIGVAVVLKAIFSRPQMQSALNGVILRPEQAGDLWYDLTTICEKVDTQPPEQIIAGIDDNFFL